MLGEWRQLHHDFLDFGTCVAGLVTESIRALHEPHSDPPASAAGAGAAPGAWGRRIAEQCQRVVLLYQPVAVDFRQVTAMLRMTT
jgi:hypothetical protein